MAVTYLFTRFRFNWSEVEFSIFSTYAMITGLFGKPIINNYSKILNNSKNKILGTLFSVGIFSHILKMDDAIIGVISSVSKILSSFVYAFAVTNWQVYLGSYLRLINKMSLVNSNFFRSNR